VEKVGSQFLPLRRLPSTQLSPALLAEAKKPKEHRLVPEKLMTGLATQSLDLLSLRAFFSKALD
jgi:hypothetical protein